MVNLAKDIRAEFKNPALPVSIAVAGFNGFNGAEATRHPPGDWVDMPPEQKITTQCTVDNQCRRLDIVLSQLAAANATRHPELGGHIAAMETRGFWRDPQFSPNAGQGYHYACTQTHKSRPLRTQPPPTHPYLPRNPYIFPHQWHNAETYYLTGRAMATGMLQAAEK